MEFSVQSRFLSANSNIQDKIPWNLALWLSGILVGKMDEAMGSNREGTDCSLTVRRKQVAQNLLSRRKSTWGKEREKSSRNKGSVRVLKCKGRMRVRKTEMSTRKGDRSVFAVLLKYMSSITMLKRFSSLHTGIRFSWGTCLMTQRKQTSESEWHQLTFAFVDRVQSNNKTVHSNVDVPQSAAADTRSWLGLPRARTSQPPYSRGYFRRF